MKLLIPSLSAFALAFPVMANAEAWPLVKAGETLVIKDRRKLPIELASILKLLCGPEKTGMSSSVEFFSLPPNNSFAVARCSFGIGWTANVFENIKDKPVPVALAVGETSTGFIVTETFSSVDIDVQKMRLVVSFETDACGEDGENTFIYQYEHSRYRLVAVKSVDCDFKYVSTKWKSSDFVE